ncbi:hypothetical protein B0F87_101465 [Methylobacter tundripaludum]|uniref:Uncharacterized protein n=1 Tax=Methylobacter tundripaludum TaxID=173365 RepID=A0A2S6HL44_9GAMM|nr:hypothetical protein B0F87_101465 [Methylobacter tundripaludum]
MEKSAAISMCRRLEVFLHRVPYKAYFSDSRLIVMGYTIII